MLPANAETQQQNLAPVLRVLINNNHLPFSDLATLTRSSRAISDCITHSPYTGFFATYDSEIGNIKRASFSH